VMQSAVAPEITIRAAVMLSSAEKPARGDLNLRCLPWTKAADRGMWDAAPPGYPSAA
jgi:hypothetical protein